MGIQPKTISGHAHVLMVNRNLATVHTKDVIYIGNFISLGNHQLLVVNLKHEESKYYPGLSFYEINFK